MTFIEAAAEVLRQAGKPLHYKEITELAIAKNLLSHVGKTPEVTMSHRLTSAIKKEDKEVPIVRVKPGIFALREWEGKKGRRTTPSSPPETVDDGNGEEADVEVNALEIEAALREAEDNGHAASSDEDDDGSPGQGHGYPDPESTGDRDTPVSGDEARRADLAASGAELFDDEDDDDQPILAPLPAQGAAAGGAPQAGTGVAGEG
ncbi:MAG: winged helix-turn-helix domain-containing protein, partial [Polyangiaceae bacterium]